MMRYTRYYRCPPTKEELGIDTDSYLCWIEYCNQQRSAEKWPLETARKWYETRIAMVDKISTFQAEIGCPGGYTQLSEI